MEQVISILVPENGKRHHFPGEIELGATCSFSIAGSRDFKTAGSQKWQHWNEERHGTQGQAFLLRR